MLLANPDTLAAEEGFKADVHGLGFDPFRGAEEFRRRKEREARRQRRAGEPPKARGPGAAFGEGLFDADDTYEGGVADEYGTEAEEHLRELGGSGSDEEEPPGPRSTGPVPLLQQSSFWDAEISGFVKARQAASAAATAPKWFPPPSIPRGWDPLRSVMAKLRAATLDEDAPEEAPPPTDPATRKAAETLAGFVARVGDGFEKLAKQKHKNDPQFRFLFGGVGHKFFRWRIHRLRAEEAARRAPPVAPGPPAAALPRAPLTAGARAALLGEVPLPAAPPGPEPDRRDRLKVSGEEAWRRRAAASAAPPPAAEPKARGFLGSIAPEDRRQLAASLGNMFTKATAEATAAPNSAAGIARGGLQSAAAMQELADRAAPKKAADEEAAAVPRKVAEWRPAYLLCKRLGVPDPFQGQAAPQAASKFKTETFRLPATEEKVEAAAPKYLAAGPGGREEAAKREEEAAADDFLDGLAAELEATPYVERQPALAVFKAIFEDDAEGADADAEAAPPEAPAARPTTKHAFRPSAPRRPPPPPPPFDDAGQGKGAAEKGVRAPAQPPAPAPKGFARGGHLAVQEVRQPPMPPPPQDARKAEVAAIMGALARLKKHEREKEGRRKEKKKEKRHRRRRPAEGEGEDCTGGERSHARRHKKRRSGSSHRPDRSRRRDRRGASPSGSASEGEE